jgi:GAF domain-containing protein/anti-sigma regulatory factor (Ser/Thr protein kinase)
MADLLIPPHLRESHARGLETYLRTGEGPLIGKRIEVPALRADGTEFPAELAVTAVQHEGVIMFAGYLRDITDRMKADRDRDHLLKLERQARAEAEAAQQRLAFLAEAGMKVASSLDFSQALQRLAEAAVPYMADWCFVDLQDEAGTVHRVAFAHALAADDALVRRLQRPVPDPDSGYGISQVLRSGESVLVTQVTEEIMRSLAPTSERYETLRALGPRSYMIVPLHSRDKTIGTVAFILTGTHRSYGEGDLTLAEDLVRRASISIDNARLYQERTYVARALQRSLLPPSLPHVPGMEIAAYYEPAGEDIDVGGDFYDVFPLGRRRWAIVIGDVCGKGAEAAAITGLARHSLRAAATQVRDPEAILKVLNESIAGQIRDERFCSVALACLEKSRDRARVTIVTAGHPPPLVFRTDGTVEPVGEPGDLLGLFPEVELAPTEIDLELGDGMLFYTDGVTEARRGERVFGLYGLRRVLEDSTGLSAAAVSRRVRDAVLKFQQRSRDDLAVLALRLARPSHARPVSFSLDLAGGFKAAEAARRSLDRLAEELAPELLEDVRLLVNELVTNAVRHARVGTGETIRLTVTVAPELVRAEVRDPGAGFEPPTGGPSLERAAGWGLYLVERFADRWGIDDSGGTCVWFEIDR